jgi:hypothetical protein
MRPSIKRRRAKKTRLRNDGKRVLNMGRGSIDQMHVNTQVEAESSKCRGQGGALWDLLGYNSRIYRIVIMAYEEEDSDLF